MVGPETDKGHMIKRLGFRAVMTLIALLVLVVIALSALTLTGPGRVVLAGLIGSLASSDNRILEIRDVDGLWSGALRVGAVTASDEKGLLLAIENIALDWKPGDLLHRTFAAQKLSIGKIHLIRLPEKNPEPQQETVADDTSAATTDESAASLPISVLLEELAIRRIVISEAVAGSEFDLRAGGKVMLDADPLHLSLDVKIERDDDVAGSAHAVVAFAPNRGLLDLDVSVREPEGGALAGLLRIPGNPSVDFLLKGTGALEDWSADLAFDLDGEKILGGKATIAAANSELAAKLDVKGEIGPLLPAPYAAIFAGTTSLALDGKNASDGGLHINLATVRTQVLSVDVAGRIDPTNSVVDLEGGLAISADAGWIDIGAPDSVLRLKNPQTKFKAKGTLADAAWTVTAALEGLQSSQGTLGAIDVNGSGSGADLNNKKVPFKIKGTVKDIVLTQTQAAMLLDGSLTLEMTGLMDGDVVRLEQSALKASGLSATGNGWFDTAASAFDGRFRIASLWPLDKTGFPGLSGDKLDLSGWVARDAEGLLQAREIKLASKALSISAEASLEAEAVNATLTGRLADLSLFNGDLSGAMGFDLSAEGPVSAANVEVTATGSEVVLRGQAVKEPSLEIVAVASADAPSGTVTVKAGFAGESLTGSARIATEASGTKQIEDIRFEFAGTELKGDLSFPVKGVPVGALSLAAPDLSKIGPLLAAEMSGALQFGIDLIDDKGALKVVADASTAEVQYTDIRVADARLAATLTDVLGTPRAEGRLTIKSVLAGTTDIADIEINASQNAAPGADAAGQTAFDIKAVPAGIPAEIGGLIGFSDQQVSVRLDRATARYKGINPKLAQPAEIVTANGTTKIGDLVIDIGGGKLSLSGSAGKILDINAKLSSIPMKLVDAVAPGTGAGGQLSGTVLISGASSDPAISYDMAWSKAGFAATRSAGLPALSLGAKGLFQQNATKFTATAGGYPGLAIKAAGTVSLAGNQAMAINVTGKLPFTLLDRQLGNQGLRLTGNGLLDLDVTGSTRKPAINGTFSTSGATFVDSNTSIVIRQLALKAGLTSDAVTIRSLTGTLARGGAVSAGGTIGIAPGQNLPADLSLKIRDGRYADGQMVSTAFNAGLTVKGPLQGAAIIGGEIILDRVDITIPEKLPRSIASLAVKHKNAPAAIVRQNKAIAPKQKSQGQSDGPGMRLDIAIRAARQIFLRGRGMDAELGGSLTLKGPVSSPVAVGGFAMRRGRLSVLQQRFDFSKGAIGFSGSLDPELDFAANTSVNSTTVTVGVTGKASNPIIGLSSSPDLPDEEILSLLLFNRGLNDITPVQAAQLASAVATLGGIGGSYGVVDRVRDSLGLSDIDISSDADGKTKVTVGKQLSDKIYLGVDQGVGKDSSRVKIDIEITKGLKARGEVGADGKSKGGLFFERNY